MTQTPARILATVGLLILGIGGSLPGQQVTSTLQGAVVDSATGEPLYFVRLFLHGTEREFQTDQAGFFRIPDLPVGTHQISMELNGYDPRGFRFNITPEHAGEIDLGVLGLAPIPSHFIDVSGVVLDVNSGEPLKEATITVGGRITTETDEDGRFEITNHEVLEGNEPVFIRRIGYESMTYPLRVNASRTSFDLDLRLQPLATRLDDIVVEGRPVPKKLEDFFLRRRQANGEFLTPWEIEAIPARHITDILAKIQGVLVSPGTYPSENRVRLARGCWDPPRLIVDGVEIRGSNFNVVSHMDAAAVEVYFSMSETPIQFQRNNTVGTCGTLIIWTK